MNKIVITGISFLFNLLAIASNSIMVPVTKPVQNVQSADDINQKMENLTRYICMARKQWNCPGVSVGIIVNGKIFFINDGVANLKTKTPVTEKTVFCVMSLSKIITVATLQKLVDEGKIDLEAPIQKYLPWFQLSDPQWTQQAKVRHLISHCIGLPQFSADTLWHLGVSQKEILEKLKLFKMKTKPGEKYAYQNMFVGIAGLLIEKVTHKSLDKVIDEYIFRKLSMDSSSVGPHPGYSGRPIIDFVQKAMNWVKKFFQSDPKHDDLATGYFCYHDNPTPTAALAEPYLFNGTSGVNSTATDYIKFLSCLLNDCQIPNSKERLLSKRAWKMMSSSQISIHDIRNSSSHFPVKRMKKGSFYYGNGIFGFKYGDASHFIDLLMHEGAGSGWRSLWLMVPSAKFGLVVLSNYGSINTSLLPEAVAYRALDMFFDFPDFDWQQWYFQSQQQTHKFFQTGYDAYVFGPPPEDSLLIGNYYSPIYGNLTIKRKKGRLEAQLRGRILPFKHIGGSVFSIDPHQLSLHYGDHDMRDVVFNTDTHSCEIKVLREDKFYAMGRPRHRH